MKNPLEDGSPRDYYAIRVQLVHVQKKSFFTTDKFLLTLSKATGERKARDLWDKIDELISKGDGAVFYK